MFTRQEIIVASAATSVAVSVLYSFPSIMRFMISSPLSFTPSHFIAYQQAEAQLLCGYPSSMLSEKYSSSASSPPSASSHCCASDVVSTLIPLPPDVQFCPVDSA